MIENISLQLNQLLGNDFVIFFENKANLIDDNEKKLWANKVVGAFYPSAGTFLPIDGVSAFTGQAFLQLLIPNSDKAHLRELEYKIQTVINSNNGVIILSDGQGYKYQLIFSNLRPIGNTEIIYGVERQPYQIDMTVILASGMQFGSDASIKIDGTKLDGVVLINYRMDNAVEPKLNINDYIASNTAQYNMFSLSCQAYIRDNELWATLQNDALFNLEKIYVIEYTKNGITKSFDAVLRQYEEINKIGEFQVANLTFVPTEPSEYVTITFDANGGYWEISNTATVTYDSNGGTGSMIDVNSPYELGSNITLLPNEFIRAGYVFVNYNDMPDGSGTAYAENSVMTLTESKTFYAQWQAAVYNIQYDANGGIGTIPLDLTDYNAGNIATVKFAPAPTKEGYAFAGWAYSPTATEPVFTADGTTTFSIEGNTTLYAVYSEYVTITFDANGGYWTEI